jgi:hypothetical protein
MLENLSPEVTSAVGFLQRALADLELAVGAIKKMPYVHYDNWFDINPYAQMGFSIFTYGLQPIDSKYFLPEVLALAYEDQRYRLFCNVSYGRDNIDEQGQPRVSELTFEIISNDEYCDFQTWIGENTLVSGLLEQYELKVRQEFMGYQEPTRFVSS